MAIKKQAVEARGSLQQGIYWVINPLVRFMIRIGITPNMVTTIGLIGNLAAAVVICVAGYKVSEYGGAIDYSLLTIAGALIVGFSLFDMLDGQVARLGNMVSTFGAMYDSCLDRYCEMFTVGAIAYYLICIEMPIAAFITLLALVGSVMVSYVRARGEGLGLECKMGFMQRPERVVLTTVALLATGITGQCLSPATDFDPNIILTVVMVFIAIFANMTAFARMNHCRKQLKAKGK